VLDVVVVRPRFVTGEPRRQRLGRLRPVDDGEHDQREADEDGEPDEKTATLHGFKLIHSRLNAAPERLRGLPYFAGPGARRPRRREPAARVCARKRPTEGRPLQIKGRPGGRCLLRGRGGFAAATVLTRHRAAKAGPIRKGDPRAALSFAESISLSSTGSADLRLPPTAFASGFDLLALRARRKRKSRRGQVLPQEVQTTKRAQFAEIQFSTFPQHTLQLVESPSSR